MPRKIQLVRAAGYALFVLGAIALFIQSELDSGSGASFALLTLGAITAWYGVKLTDYKTTEFPLSSAERTFAVIFKRTVWVACIAWSLLSVIQALRIIF